MLKLDHKKMVHRLTEGRPTVLMICAENCAPCTNAESTLDQMDKQHEKLDFIKIDIKDVEPGFLHLRNIRSAPTVIAFAYGMEENRVTGFKESALTGLVKDLAETTDYDADEEIACEACQ